MALRVGERLRKSVSMRHFNAGAKAGPLPITVSIGVAAFNGINDSMEGLLKRGDDALYKAKREGRNRVCFKDSDSDDVETGNFRVIQRDLA